ncbi:elongation factor G [Ruficoccus amylovorans]|uniref:Elongation factor G n=1 Tax=Ruficoccus amylovorans TaxID=1804625 RepID=A0A842HHQ2_9BACT|nr:elongation factor G [Ruficoccus amylovorans]MBC2596275.1 elongation factor G [Ruficoccus amylovorans]
MKNYHAADIRNCAVVGHASTGKTLLCDAMLVCAGQIGKVGSIEAGSSVSDYHADEREHQMSIHASLLHTEWLGKKFNLIDCPGAADFVSEPLSALRVADFALVVVNGCHGIEPGTDMVYDTARAYDIPRMIAVNLLDKENTAFELVLEEARSHFGAKVFPMTIPLNAGPGFNRVLDVMRTSVITYHTDGSGGYDEAPATGELAARVKALHKELIEYVAETDDSLMELFFEKESLSEDELREHLHAAIQQRVVVPLFAVSGQANVGVARMMDIIAKYGSSPLDRQRVAARDVAGDETEVALDGEEPCLFVFKTLNEQHVGGLSFFRVYSGGVSHGMDLRNVSRNGTERIGQIFLLNGRERAAVDHLNCGDIGAAVKLRDTHTGDTLCGGKLSVTLPTVAFPEPNIHGALRVASRSDEEKISQGLHEIQEEDPTFVSRYDPELKQTIISGQGEVQLKVAAEEIKRRYNVDIELIEPRVPYRETIRTGAESRYRHKKQSGGAGQFAEVWMRIEPLPRGSGVEFTNSLVGNNVDRVFVASVEKGVRSACEEGVVGGFHVQDVKIDFFDGKQHPVDSKDIAFQIAGKAAFQEAFRNAQPSLLEPILSVRVTVPDECVGDVMGDLSSRRGRINGVESEGKFQVIDASVPQAELYRYATRLRSLTAGRGRHRESFSHYEEVPPDQEARILDRAQQLATAG